MPYQEQHSIGAEVWLKGREYRVTTSQFELNGGRFQNAISVDDEEEVVMIATPGFNKEQLDSERVGSADTLQQKAVRLRAGCHPRPF